MFTSKMVLWYAKADFSIYQDPKIVTEDPTLFHNVAQIPNAML